MSIESIEKREYSTKSDVWAFAITVIEIMTSAPPYSERDPVNVAIKVINGLRPTIPDDRPKKLAGFISFSSFFFSSFLKILNNFSN